MAKLPDPELVATGRIRVPIEQLVALVHAVNPTDKGLNAREKANRYVLKSRLQSLLIREHKESFEVVATGEGIVSLRHRVDGHDACHAVVTELEDDARRWVETELAVRKPSRATTSKPVPVARGDALARGRAALDDYDYDTARAEFEAALPSAVAARALLDLFVNHLADDAGALALATRFSDLAAEPDVALAAARSGDPRAEAWARASRSAEAFALLAETALRSDATRAARLLDALKDADAAHPAVARIAAALAERRREERGPMEAALVGIADPAAKEAAARDILRRWPESVPARAALREVEEGRRRAATGSLADAARQAMERHDYDAVVGIAERARRDGVAVDEHLEALEARARSVLRALRIHRALGALRADDFAPWFELPQADRELARREATHALLAVVERIPAGNTRAAAGGALVRAHAEPTAAPELLHPYERLLHGIPEAWRMVESELARRAAIAKDERLGKLDRAEAALAAGDLDAAEKLAADARTPGERERVAAIRKKVEAAREAARKAEKLRALREAGDLVGALEVAQDGGDTAQIAELDAAIRLQWRVEFVRGLPHRAPDVGLDHAVLNPPVALTPAGELVYARSYGNDVFFSRCPSTGTTPDLTMAVRTPERFHLMAYHVDTTTVWAFAKSGAILRVGLGEGGVQRWCPAPGLDGEDRFAEYPVVTAGGRYVWMTICDPEGRHELRVYDVDNWPQYRAIEPWGHAHPLLGLRSPGVGVTRSSTGAMLYTPAGTRAGERSALGRMPASRLVLAPDGTHISGLGNATIASKLPELKSSIPDDLVLGPLHDPDLMRFSVGIERRVAEVDLFSGARLRLPHHLAASRATGLTYIRTEAERGAEVNALAGQDHAFSIKVPRHTVLLTDETASTVRAFCERVSGIDELALAPDPAADAQPGDDEADEDDPPEIQPRALEFAMSGIEAPLRCTLGPNICPESALTIAEDLAGRSREEAAAWLAAAREAHAHDADFLFDLTAVARRMMLVQSGIALQDALRANHATHPRWRLLEAEQAHAMRNWGRVESIVADLDGERLTAPERQHLFHLRAILALRAGDPSAADEFVGQARGVEGGLCVLDPIERFVAVKLGHPREGLLESFVATLRRVDEHLANGAFAEAFELCDDRLVWIAGEAQSSARRAEAAIQLGPGEGLESIRRRLARAAFVDLWASRHEYVVTNLPIDGAWDEAKLEELAARAGE